MLFEIRPIGPIAQRLLGEVAIKKFAPVAYNPSKGVTRRGHQAAPCKKKSLGCTAPLV